MHEPFYFAGARPKLGPEVRISKTALSRTEPKLAKSARESAAAEHKLRVWIKRASPAAPALLQVAARLTAEEGRADSKFQPPPFHPPPMPYPDFGLSVADYTRAVAVAEAAAYLRAAAEHHKAADTAAFKTAEAHSVATGVQHSRQRTAEECEQQAEEMLWPRSPSKCRRKGLDAPGTRAEVIQTVRSLRVQAAAKRRAYRNGKWEVFRLLVADDNAQMRLARARQGLDVAQHALWGAMCALGPEATRRSVRAGILPEEVVGREWNFVKDTVAWSSQRRLSGKSTSTSSGMGQCGSYGSMERCSQYGVV